MLASVVASSGERMAFVASGYAVRPASSTRPNSTVNSHRHVPMAVAPARAEADQGWAGDGHQTSSCIATTRAEECCYRPPRSRRFAPALPLWSALSPSQSLQRRRSQMPAMCLHSTPPHAPGSRRSQVNITFSLQSVTPAPRPQATSAAPSRAKRRLAVLLQIQRP